MELRDAAEAVGAQALARFEDPARILDQLDALCASGDPLVAPPSAFLERPGDPHHERWPYPINFWTCMEIDAGRLLALPPGSRRYGFLRKHIPDLLDAQRNARFPRLAAELANRPNLFFPGVFFPHEIELREIEMASAHHGQAYVSMAEFALAGESEPARVCLKPAPMGVEAIVSHTLRMLSRLTSPAFRARWGVLRAPTIVSIRDPATGAAYGILEYLPGKNGVEFLPRGVATGGLRALHKNEYPEDLHLTRDEVFFVAREFAKQAVLAYYLRLFDRKPDQILFDRDAEGRLTAAHIDFGRGIKRNYALPWKRHYDPTRAPLEFDDHEIPYFEAAAGLLYLPHFIPAAHRDLSPFEGPLAEEIEKTFVAWAKHIRANTENVVESFSYLLGETTQYRSEEVFTTAVTPDDLAAVYAGLEALDDPRETIRSILALARHERDGTTPTHRLHDPCGDRSLRLVAKTDDYELADPRARGFVRYDAEEKILDIAFAKEPEKVLHELEASYSPRLTAFLKRTGTRLTDLRLAVRADGEAVALWTAGRSVARRRDRVPEEICDEITQSWATRFARRMLHRFPEIARSIAAGRDPFSGAKDNNPWEREVEKHRLIFAADPGGREVLAFLAELEPKGTPLRCSFEEVLGDLYAVGDFLLDKDPFDTVSAYLVGLGKKYGFVPPPAPSDFPPLLRRDEAALADLAERFADDELVPHRVHLLLITALADEIGARLDLDEAERRRLLWAAALHDLNVFDPAFRRVLLEPGGRTLARFMTEALDAHPHVTASVFDRLRAAGELPCPADIDLDALRSDLLRHHRRSEDGATTIEQILHLADNLAVFGDGARPDNWNRGPLPLAESGPRWIEAQVRRGQTSEAVAEAAMRLFTEEDGRETIAALEAVSFPYLSAFDALHLTALLRWGLHPLHPGLREELAGRYGREEVDLLFDRVVASNLTARDKVLVLSRVDDLGPLIPRIARGAHRFLNASVRPVQRTVEAILDSVKKGETVILVGYFPRAVKAFQRTLAAGVLARDEIERIVVACGTKRLQFIHYSYPYEADFDRPFHEVIDAYRKETGETGRIVLIPFARFFEALGEKREAVERIDPGERRGEVVRGEEATSDLARFAKVSRGRLEIPEKVEAEARRFLRRFGGAAAARNVDAVEAERFRRILLSGFTNREVLYFYAATTPEGAPLRAALADAIEALHENPNYLSDRSFYYGLHEITKSLSLVHFPRPGVPPDMPPPPRPELAFALDAFRVASEIAPALCRRARLDEASAARIAGNLRRASVMTRDEVVGEYLLSPEDLRTNAALRDALRLRPKGLYERIEAEGGVAMNEKEEEVFHAALFLAFHADRYRIENWREAHILPRLPEDLPGEVARTLEDAARRSAPVVELYNALSLAAEFRWGLSPRGLDLIANVRTLQGSELADLIIDAVVASPLNARDRVKFARKIRIWAAPFAPAKAGGAATLFPGDGGRRERPKRLRFLHCDRMSARRFSAFGFTFPGLLDEVLETDDGETQWIVAGSYEHAGDFVREAASRLSEKDLRRFHLAVSEETLLLVKEPSLRYTDAVRARLRRYRADEKITRRRFLAPATLLLDLPEPKRAEPPKGDPSYRALAEWVGRFD